MAEGPGPEGILESKQKFVLKGDYLDFFMYNIQHCFICRPSDSTVSDDAGIGPRIVATTALAVRRSNHSARSHPQKHRKKNNDHKKDPVLNLVEVPYLLYHQQEAL